MPHDIDGEAGEVMLERYGASLIGIRNDSASEYSMRSTEKAKLLPGDSNFEERSLSVGNVLLVEVYPRSFDLISSDFTLITASRARAPQELELLWIVSACMLQGYL